MSALAQLLNISVGASVSESDSEEEVVAPQPPAPVPEPEQQQQQQQQPPVARRREKKPSKKFDWESAVQTVESDEKEENAKNAMQRCVGVLNRMFALACRSNNKGDMTRSLKQRMHTLVSAYKNSPHTLTVSNLPQDMDRVLSGKLSVDDYVDKRISRMKTGTFVPVDVQRHNQVKENMCRTACIFLRSFNITNEGELKQCARKMRSEEEMMRSVSARSLFALFTHFCEENLNVILNIVKLDTQVPETIDALAFAFYLRVLKECRLETAISTLMDTARAHMTVVHAKKTS